MPLGALQQQQQQLLLSSCANALGEHMEEFKQRLLRLQKQMSGVGSVVLQLFCSVVNRDNFCLLPDSSGNIFYFKVILDSKGKMQICFFQRGFILP